MGNSDILSNKKPAFAFLYKADLKRYSNNPPLYLKRLHFFLRKTQCSHGINKKIWRWFYIRQCNKKCIEISDTAIIGAGLYIGHPSNITINGASVIGNNCNIHKGCVIGQENRGKRKGAPIIGNNVWIGINAVVVGKIEIGDDVLIAPNSFVNCDVPSHSIVLGNPCVIISKENATEDYINNIFASV